VTNGEAGEAFQQPLGESFEGEYGSHGVGDNSRFEEDFESDDGASLYSDRASSQAQSLQHLTLNLTLNLTLTPTLILTLTLNLTLLVSQAESAHAGSEFSGQTHSTVDVSPIDPPWKHKLEETETQS